MDEKGTGLFDVTMGCFDGAEVCRLVGAFVLATLSKAVPSSDIGLYRDDGLGALRSTPGTEADRIRKDVIRIFGEQGLRITIQTNLKVADFLDVTLNLNSELLSIPKAQRPAGVCPLPIQPPPKHHQELKLTCLDQSPAHRHFKQRGCI